MTLEEVKKFIAENKDSDDVKEFLGSFATPEADVIKRYQASQEFRDELQREGDRRVTSALDKFQKEKLPKHVEEEIRKRFPEETESDKKLRSLQQQVEELTAGKLKEELKNRTAQIFNEKKLPLELSEIIQAGDEQELTSKAEKIAAVIERVKIDARNEMLKGAPDPRKSSEPAGQIRREDLAKMDAAEVTKLTNEGKLDHLLGRT